MDFQPKRILVATDFSAASRAAGDAAADLARTLGAELTLFHVAPVAPRADAQLRGDQVFAFERAVRRGVEEDGEAERARLAARGVEVRFATVDGAAAPEIVRAATEGGYGLIVVGSVGRTGLARVLLGSVAEAVVRRAPMAVLTVRGPGGSGADAGAPAPA